MRTSSIFVDALAAEYKAKIEELERELWEARYDLIAIAPDVYWSLLCADGYPMDTWHDFRSWESEAINKIADDVRGLCPCPLCGALVRAWGPSPERGWTRSGLVSHLNSRMGEKVSRCRVFQAAWHMHRDKNLKKFREAAWHEDKRKHEETERRKKTDPLIRLGPHGEPEFFEMEKYGYAPRSPEDLARSIERLREAGFTVVQTDNVTAYKLVRDNWMMFADPRAAFRLEVHVFSIKRTDKLGRTHWKGVGRIDVRGTKDWPAKIEARFQEMGAPPVVVPEPPPVPAPESKPAKPPKRTMPPRISMWDAINKQENGR